MGLTDVLSSPIWLGIGGIAVVAGLLLQIASLRASTVRPLGPRAAKSGAKANGHVTIFVRQPALTIAIARSASVFTLVVLTFILSTWASGATARSILLGWVVLLAFMYASALVVLHAREVDDRWVRWLELCVDALFLVTAIVVSDAGHGEPDHLTKSPAQLLFVGIVLLAAARGAPRFTVAATLVNVVAYLSLFAATYVLAPSLIQSVDTRGDLAHPYVGPSRVAEVAAFIGVNGALAAYLSWLLGERSRRSSRRPRSRREPPAKGEDDGLRVDAAR